MGNCFTKRKNLLNDRLQADICFLQKENLRTYDYILGELAIVKSMINENQSDKSVIKHRKVSSV